MAFFTMAFFTMAFYIMAFFTMAFSETHRVIESGCEIFEGENRYITSCLNLMTWTNHDRGMKLKPIVKGLVTL